MTILDAAEMIGKTATLIVGTLHVRVHIKNVKHTYGRMRFEVGPCSGEGTQWVDGDRLTQVL